MTRMSSIEESSTREFIDKESFYEVFFLIRPSIDEALFDKVLLIAGVSMLVEGSINKKFDDKQNIEVDEGKVANSCRMLLKMTY